MAAEKNFAVVAVAASAGGLQALEELFAGVPAVIPAAFLVVQHLAPMYPSVLAAILGRHGALTVSEAVAGEHLRPGHVLVAPPNQHMLVDADGRISLTQAPRVHFVRPAADVLFGAVAEAFGPRVVAVVLSGTGQDGAIGVQDVKRHGGTVLVQAGATQPYFSGMPDAAIRTGIVDQALPLAQIGPAIASLVEAIVAA